MVVILIAVGGGLGASARWLIASAIGRSGDGFPLGVTVVNVTGAFLLGVVSGVSLDHQAPELTQGLATGVLGGFTTFSTWMVDIDEASTPAASRATALIPLASGLIAAACGVAVGSVI